MVIKHIVISGGGPSSLITYGTLKELHNRKFWKLENIQNLHGCSAGSFLSLIILLDYNWEWIDDFFIKRPWNELMDIKPEELLNVNSNLGIIDYKFMSKVISPLLEGKGLSKDITMKDSSSSSISSSSSEHPAPNSSFEPLTKRARVD